MLVIDFDTLAEGEEVFAGARRILFVELEDELAGVLVEDLDFHKGVG